MDGVRYLLALFLVLLAPGVFLYWFSIHPFIRFWRSVGPRLTIVIHYGFILILAAGVFLIRKPLLSIEFGANPVLIVLAVPLYVLVIVLRVQLSKQVGTKVIHGLPELAPEKYGSRLVTGGIYSRIRHPRYVQLLLAILTFAMVGNYLAGYVVVLAAVVWVFLVTRVEEKELRERFGAEHEAYCARVPRFVPKL
jgi:protein-S-isoprenylcysteine O-methyltransferase Ste14